MKRNFPPDDEAADLIRLEREIIDERLNEAFKLTKPIRTVLNTNRATYLKQYQHVRLESGCRQLEGFSRHSSSYGYHYLQPIQALFLLESRQIVIYYNELPLSIAEAYKLFLENKNDFQNYVVFTHLNRSGYFCLPHHAINLSQDPLSTGEPDVPAEGGDIQSDKPLITKQIESTRSTQPLLGEIDIQDGTASQIMESLIEYGPRLGNDPTGQLSHNSPLISYDAYKRETFNRNKPRRGYESGGKPDYHVIVQDKNCTSLPGTTNLRGGAARDCNKYLFAIIDTDSSLSFVQCDTLTDPDLN